MENHLIQPFVFDFFGLPASGKSTISHQIVTTLKNNGYKIKEPSFFIDHKVPKIFRVFLKAFIILFHPFLFFKSRKIVLMYEYSGFELIKQTSNIIQKIVAIKKNKKQLVVLDQGIIQAELSLSINKTNDISLFLDFVKKEIGDCKVIPIFLNTNQEECLDRLKKRRTKDSRIEKKNETERTECINHINKLISRTLREINYVEISDVESGIKIARTIINQYDSNSVKTLW